MSTEGTLGGRAPAIAELYRVFADCPLPEKLDYCEYCDDEEYEQSLHEPLETLPLSLVDKFLADSIHHTGDGEDFLHFVPRIIELEYDAGLDSFFVFPGRLWSARYARWSAARRDAMCRVLERVPTHRMVDQQWLSCVGRIEGIDMGVMLRGWIASPGREADDLEWLAHAISLRSLAKDTPTANAALASYLRTEDGALLAAEYGLVTSPGN